MSQTALSFVFLLITHLKLVSCQIQLHVEGNSGLKRAPHLHGGPRVSYGNFAVDMFHRLQVSVGSSTVVSRYKECAMSCVNTPSCSSFNVASSPDVDGKFRCELLDQDKYSSLDQLISSRDYHHYSIKVSIKPIFTQEVFGYFPTSRDYETKTRKTGGTSSEMTIFGLK